MSSNTNSKNRSNKPIFSNMTEKEAKAYKHELYVFNNTLKKTYHQVTDESTRLRTKIRTLDKELTKMKGILNKNKGNFKQRYYIGDTKVNLKTEISKESSVDYGFQSVRRDENILFLKESIREMKKDYDQKDQEIQEIKFAIKDSNSTNVEVEFNLLLSKHNRTMNKITKKHSLNIQNKNLLHERINNLLEKKEKAKKNTEYLQKLKDNLETIVKKNKNSFKTLTHTCINSPLKSHRSTSRSSNASVINLNEILDDKIIETEFKEDNIKALYDTNEYLCKAYETKIYDISKENPEEAGTIQKNYDKLNAQMNLHNEYVFEYKEYCRVCEESTWLFRNLQYNLQLEFISKADFLLKLSNDLDSDTKIGYPTFETLIDRHVIFRMQELENLDATGIHQNMQKIFFSYKKSEISKNEILKKFDHFLSNYEHYTSDDNLQQYRDELSSEQKDINSEDKAIIVNKLKDLIGLSKKTEYISDLLVKKVLENTFTKGIRDVILQDTFLLSQRDCRSLSFYIFKKLLRTPKDTTHVNSDEEYTQIIQEEYNSDLRVNSQNCPQEYYYNNLFGGSIEEEQDKETQNDSDYIENNEINISENQNEHLLNHHMLSKTEEQIIEKEQEAFEKELQKEDDLLSNRCSKVRDSKDAMSNYTGRCKTDESEILKGNFNNKANNKFADNSLDEYKIVPDMLKKAENSHINEFLAANNAGKIDIERLDSQKNDDENDFGLEEDVFKEKLIKELEQDRMDTEEKSSINQKPIETKSSTEKIQYEDLNQKTNFFGTNVRKSSSFHKDKNMNNNINKTSDNRKSLDTSSKDLKSKKNHSLDDFDFLNEKNKKPDQLNQNVTTVTANNNQNTSLSKDDNLVNEDDGFDFLDEKNKKIDKFKQNVTTITSNNENKKSFSKSDNLANQDDDFDFLDTKTKNFEKLNPEASNGHLKSQSRTDSFGGKGDAFGFVDEKFNVIRKKELRNKKNSENNNIFQKNEVRHSNDSKHNSQKNNTPQKNELRHSNDSKHNSQKNNTSSKNELRHSNDPKLNNNKESDVFGDNQDSFDFLDDNVKQPSNKGIENQNFTEFDAFSDSNKFESKNKIKPELNKNNTEIEKIHEKMKDNISLNTTKDNKTALNNSIDTDNRVQDKNPQLEANKNQSTNERLKKTEKIDIFDEDFNDNFEENITKEEKIKDINTEKKNESEKKAEHEKNKTVSTNNILEVNNNINVTKSINVSKDESENTNNRQMVSTNMKGSKNNTRVSHNTNQVSTFPDDFEDDNDFASKKVKSKVDTRNSMMTNKKSNSTNENLKISSEKTNTDPKNNELKPNEPKVDQKSDDYFLKDDDNQDYFEGNDDFLLDDTDEENSAKDPLEDKQKNNTYQTTSDHMQKKIDLGQDDIYITDDNKKNKKGVNLEGILNTDAVFDSEFDLLDKQANAEEDDDWDI